MSYRVTTRKTALAATTTVGVVVGLLCSGGGAAQARIDTATAAAAAPMTQASLLRFDDIHRAGLAVDSAELGTRGDQLLGDAGRFDEGCLGEKTMRNITSSKDYPAPGDARAYVDGTWTSTRDKDIWLSESIAQGRTTAATSRYVRTLLAEVRHVRSCEEDPAQGHHYGAARTIKAGSATGTYFLDYETDGSSDGGGVAVIRDGDRFGFVDLMFGKGRPGTTLKRLTVAAAQRLR
jgi:hypothetical protein